MPSAGLGLYAYNKTSNHDILFRRGDSTIKYDAERLTELQLNRRYGDDGTAPYAVRVNKNIIEDGALQRSAGSMANHKARTYANADLTTNYKFCSLKATKNIRNGQEIFVDYGSQYRFNEDDYSYKTK